jgi:ribonuclease J
MEQRNVGEQSSPKPAQSNSNITHRPQENRNIKHNHNNSNRRPQRHKNTYQSRNELSQQLRVCTLSGTKSIGRNCNFVELGDEIIIVDFGFGFPNEDQLGIDYLVPNYMYLKKHKQRIKGIIVTHGHLDHTGGLSYALEELGYPTVYAGRFAAELIKHKLKETKQDLKTKIIPVHRNTKIQLGQFEATFIGVTHSIPNSFGVFLEHKKGNIYFSGDYKIDTEPANEPESDYEALKKLRGKVDLALMESTNASRDGKAKSSKEIADNIETVIRGHDKRIVVVAFSSIISRIHSIIEVAEKTNRKVFISGRSLRQSISIARTLRYIEPPENLIIDEKDLNKYPDNQVLFLCTGSQGELYGALNRISLEKHKYFKIKDGDKILMAASEIPTNMQSINDMTDRLILLGADIVQNDSWRIHESGHGLKEDMKILYDLVQPKAVMPIHGDLTRRYKNCANYVEWGVPKDQAYLTTDGQTWNFTGKHWTKGKSIDAKPIMIDGLGVGDIGDVVLRDRQQLSEYGMVTVVLNLSSKGKKIIGRPRFMSRGFVYVKTSQPLFNEMENVVKDIHRGWQNEGHKNKRFEYNILIEEIEKKLKKVIYKKTEREPMILVVLI